MHTHRNPTSNTHTHTYTWNTPSHRVPVHVPRPVMLLLRPTSSSVPIQRDLDAAKAEVAAQHEAVDQAERDAKQALSDYDGSKAEFDIAKAGVDSAAYDVEHMCSLPSCWVAGVDLSFLCDVVELACIGTRETLLLAFEGAKEVLDGTQMALDLSAEMLSQATEVVQAGHVVLDGANVALDVAKGSLVASEAYVVVANTAFTAANAALDVAKGPLAVANGVLVAANAVLEGVRVTVAAGLQASQWIVSNAVSGLIDIQRLEFEMDMDTAAISEGKIFMEMTARFLGNAPTTLSLDIDFADIPGTVVSVAESIFKGITSI